VEIKDKIDSLMKSQREVLKQYEELMKEINIDDPINENTRLKKKVEQYEKNLEELTKRQAKLSKENMNLNIALRDQMANEKLGVLNASRNKAEIYFKDEDKKQTNKLKAFETSTKSKLNQMKRIAEKELGEDKKEIDAEIKDMELGLQKMIAYKKEKLAMDTDQLQDEAKTSYEKLAEDEVSKEVIEKKKKYNDIEVKIGLNLINKIGIILILLGTATVMKYTYTTWMNNYVKGISGFILGILFLGSGEWFNKKNKSLFALGLIGGGIGVLYLSVFSSYFILEILTMTTSMFVSILITLASMALSQRYKSMTIGALSLVGGYLPFFSYVFTFGISGNAIYIAMGYLLILNLLVLGISVVRRWIYIKYLSFVFNIPCLIYLIDISPDEMISIGYALVTFVMYLGITLIYPLREKVKFKIADMVLLGLNTVINCLLVYFLFEEAGYGEFRGIIALTYALIYLGLGQLVHKSSSQEIRAQALFYLTAMTFSILMIPFHFGIEWASLGWLIESVLIITYAVRRDFGRMEMAGWVILLLCAVNFSIYDFHYYWPMEYFAFKYTMMTLGFIIVLSMYAKALHESEMFKYTKKGMLLMGYKYFTIVTTWIYIIRMTFYIYDKYLPYHATYEFYFFILIALLTGFYAYFISKIKIIGDVVLRGISIGLYILVDLFCILLNFISIRSEFGQGIRILSILILILYNIFVILSIKELTVKLIRWKNLSIEIYPMAMAVYFLGASIAIMINQFNLGNINLIISVFLIVMAFVFIALGFQKQFILLRRTGLGLSVFSTGKLFIADLAFLETGGKIIAYFCFGLTLIGISYVYERLRRNIDKIEGEEL
jgi:uncharacterized membrane protein